MGRMTSECLDIVAEWLATLRARQEDEALVIRHQNMTVAELSAAWNEVVRADDEPLRLEWRNLTTASLATLHLKSCEMELPTAII